MTMQIPTRLRALIALTELLQAITVADGYQHDLATSVFRGRVLFGSDDPLPMLAIVERPVEDLGGVESPRGSQVQRTLWDLLVQGFVRDDKANPSDPAHYLLADVKKRLAIERSERRQPNLLGMEGRVADMQIGAGVVRPPDDTSTMTMFWLPLTLELVEDLSNPFA
jgi:hypothetical protein